MRTETSFAGASTRNRVLVIIGAAHGPILRELLGRVPGVGVMPPGDALR